MNRHITVGLAMVASAGLGAAAVQTLHAQAKPPAYNIAEITTKEQDGYNKEYLPLVTKAITDAGGKFIVRGGKTISYEGAAPAPRVVVVQFESLDKLQALYNSAPYKDAIAVGDKYATQRIFGVEGVSSPVEGRRFKPLVPSANESERECRRRLENRRQCWGGPRFESLILRQ